MKNKRLGLLLSLVVWCCAMTAQVVVFNAEKDKSTSEERDCQTITKDGITISLSCPDNPNASSYGDLCYGRYTIRENCVLTVETNTKNIVKVELIRASNKNTSLKKITINSGSGDLIKLSDTKVVWSGYVEEVGLLNKNSAVWISEIRVTLNTFTITDSNYATLCLDNAFKMPKGVVGHTVYVKGGVLSYLDDYNTDDVVPGGTPILIEGNAGTFEYCVGSGGHADNKNMLRQSSGTSLGPWSDYLYKLSYDKRGNNVGFYWDSEDGHSINNVPEDKCYLRVPVSALSSDTSSAAKGFTLANVINKIGGVKVDKTFYGDGKIYSLSGVYVGDDSTELEKGLYIQNGKKIVIK